MQYFRIISDGSFPAQELDDFWICEDCNGSERMEGYEVIDSKHNTIDDCECEFCGTTES